MLIHTKSTRTYEIAVQVRELMNKYSDMCNTPRVAIGSLSSYAMMEGWSVVDMRLPCKVNISFEIENAKCVEQLGECNTFAQELISILVNLQDKYGYELKKLSFTRSYEMYYSNRHYLPNKNKFTSKTTK